MNTEPTTSPDHDVATLVLDVIIRGVFSLIVIGCWVAYALVSLGCFYLLIRFIKWAWTG
jgi:hypothetical protein